MMGRYTVFATLLIGHVHGLYAADPVAVEVQNVRRVFHNGEHNAFTDMIQFHGRYYLTFRSCPDGHMVHPTASVIVLSSDDLRNWQQVFRFQVKDRDTRDPHFLVFRDRLWVYTGTWYSGPKTIPPSEYDLNLHLGFAVWTMDGELWHGPQMLDGTFGHYIWRAETWDGRAFLCGRRKRGFDVRPRGEGPEVESLMLESDDGLIWRKRAVFQPIDGDETAFRFLEDGSLIAIGRRGRKSAQLIRADPSWQHWERIELDRYIGGPLLIRWGKRWVVGGRKLLPGEPAQTALYWLVNDQLVEFATLPSGGDTSYPGIIVVDERKAVVSWYSSHEKGTDGKTITAIYMADLVQVRQ